MLQDLIYDLKNFFSFHGLILKRISSIFFSAFLTLGMIIPSFGQIAGPGPKSTWVALPIVYHTPETSWAFGAGLSYTFHLDTVGLHPSTIRFGGVYTLEKQLLTYGDFHFYHPEKKWEISGRIGYNDYVYQYWGTGVSNKTTKEIYKMRFPQFEVSPKWILHDYWRLGLSGDFNYYYDVDTEPGGHLDRYRVPGVRGGWVNGFGMILQYDRREHTIFPVRGFYGSAKLLYYGNPWGSDYEFISGTLDFRYYKYLSLGMIWASQGLFSFREGNEIPFYHLSMLGGSSMLRGFYDGRYRDQNMWALQSELRLPVWRRILVVPFAAVGEVFNFEEYNSAVHVSGGLGLRYIVDHENRVNVRLDAAYGDQFRFYLTILEAF